MATGRPLSRSAIHEDPQALRDLASRVDALADWSQTEINVPGPQLRGSLLGAVSAWRAAHGLEGGAVEAETTRYSRRPVVPADDTPALRRLVRHLYGSLPPGLLGSTVRRLDQADRDLLLAIVAEAEREETTGVLQVVRPPRASTETTQIWRQPERNPRDDSTNKGARGPDRGARGPGPGLAAG